MDPSWVALLILTVTVVLFVSDRLPLDLVAMMALCALALTGLVTPAEALAGFANPVVIMIAGLFVVGAALQEAGVTAWIGTALGRLAGGSEARLMVVIMATSAVASSFMSSTGTVAILLPVVVGIARRTGRSPARLLIPLAFASLLGGMLTLIGTPPNIVVSDELRRHGHEGFAFFSFTPAGIVLALVGIGFMATVGRRLLPGGRADDDVAPPSVTQQELAVDYGVASRLSSWAIGEGSPLDGKLIRDADLRGRFGVTILGIRRRGDDGDWRALRVTPSRTLRTGDEVRLLSFDRDRVAGLQAELGLQARPSSDAMLPPEECMAELVVPRRSRFVGKTLRDVSFRTRHRSTCIAVQRAGRLIEGDLAAAVLQPGDALLVKGMVKNIDLLGREARDFVVLTETRAEGEAQLSLRQAGPALGWTLVMLVLMTFRIVPNVIAVLLAVVGMVLTRCLTTVEAYRRINWESVVVVAAVLPMATALDQTGALAKGVTALVDGLGSAGPRLIMAALFLLTSVASQLISNTATTVLVAPVAYQVAAQLELAPEPFLIAIALAASTAFATPVASPVNMLVLHAGRYRFTDFLRVGVPLQLVLFAVAMAVVPALFPF